MHQEIQLLISLLYMRNYRIYNMNYIRRKIPYTILSNFYIVSIYLMEYHRYNLLKNTFRYSFNIRKHF